MRAVEAIVAELQERDLLDTARSFARSGRISVEELLSPSREQHIVHPRQAFIADLYDHHSFSTERIGTLLGFDRSSVRAGIKAHRARVERAENDGTTFDDRIAALEARCDHLERAVNRLERLDAARAEEWTRMSVLLEKLSKGVAA